MKILHLIYDHLGNPWLSGGGAVRAYEIYRRLRKNHDITLVCGMYPGAYNSKQNGLQIHFVGDRIQNYSLSTFCYTVKAINYIIKNNKYFDLLIEDYSAYNPLFSFLFTKVPLILQVHHREGANILKKYLALGLPFAGVESCYLKFFRNIIAVSDETKKKFSISDAIIIPNGLNQHLFELPDSQGSYVAYLGRIDIYNKGLDTLINSIRLTGLNLILAGKGRDEGKLNRLIMNSNVKGRMQMVGYLPEAEKIALIKGAKFIVVPSRYEGQCIVVLEAAACGKPVIVSDIPELRYSIENGFGISFRKGDSEDLAEKIEYLWNRPDLIREMGERGRKYASQFTWDRIADEYEKYLYQVLYQK